MAVTYDRAQLIEFWTSDEADTIEAVRSHLTA